MKTLSRPRVVTLGLALLTTFAVALTASPASAGPVRIGGIWTFTEGSGQTAFDYSFNNNHGVLGSSTARDDADPTRIRTTVLPWNTGLSFDGGDYVRVANSPTLEPDGVTVVARLRSNATPGSFRYVVAKGALRCETASYGLYTDADGALRFYVSDGSRVVISEAAPANVWDGRWHTVVGAFDGNSVRLFVDRAASGVPVPTDSLRIAYGLPDTNDLYLGDYAGPCGSNELGFRGELDGVALVGSTLAAPAATALVN